MSIVFAAPIPGQSLTATPRNLPFERPPEVNDPLDALMMHIDKIDDPRALKDMIVFMEKGLTLVALVEGMLRSAVMSGIHSIDLSLIIAPALHEYIRGILVEAGVEFKEGFEEDDPDDGIDYERDREKALTMLRNLGEDEDLDSPTEEVEEVKEEEEEPMMGLMARRQ